MGTDVKSIFGILSNTEILIKSWSWDHFGCKSPRPQASTFGKPLSPFMDDPLDTIYDKTLQKSYCIKFGPKIMLK